MKIALIAALLAAVYYAWRRTTSGLRAMSQSDAAKLLEVPTTASSQTIIAAHKRLIAKVHPDAGGSAELAARVNQARDIMLRALSN